MIPEKYPVYKGLQRPIVFKMFKGKFIYYAAGITVGSILVAGIIAATVSSIVGLIALIATVLPGMFFILNKQKKGLHDKNNYTGTIIYPPICRIPKNLRNEKK